MLRKLSLAFTFAFFTACATPETQSSISVQTEAPAVQLPTDFSVEPVVWETAGNSVQPGFMIADTATRNLVVTFEYVGSGEVQVPEGGTISAGENQVSYEGSFEAKPCSNDSAGHVQVVACDEETGLVVSEVTWPVVHRQEIIGGVEFVRTTPLYEEDYFACYVSVQYVPMSDGIQAPASRGEYVNLSAKVAEQGRFNPDVHVESDLQDGAHQSMPADFKDDRSQCVFFVSVQRPDYPPVRRAYIEVVASIGGDTQKIFIPLPNR